MKEVKPIEKQQMRFGNTAFRTFYKASCQINRSLSTALVQQIDLEPIKNMLTKQKGEGLELNFKIEDLSELIIEELTMYLDESYGNNVIYYISFLAIFQNCVDLFSTEFGICI